MSATSSPPTTDFRHLKAWGWMMGSHQSYVDEQIRQAAADGAPADAVFKRDGTWSRFADVTSLRTRDTIDGYFERQGWGKP